MEILKSTTPQDERSKSALRMRYLAEVEVLKKDLGELEDARAKLGLSRRKICQLLLVDPSAWTRWSKKPETCPPHIWKMLHFLLSDKTKLSNTEIKFHELDERLNRSVQTLEKKLKMLFYALGGTLIGITVVIALLLLSSL